MEKGRYGSEWRCILYCHRRYIYCRLTLRKDASFVFSVTPVWTLKQSDIGKSRRAE